MNLKKKSDIAVGMGLHLVGITHLLEMVAKLDHRNVIKHPVRVHHQLAVLQRVNVTLDQQQIRARFDGKESATRNVDTVGTLEVLDGCSRRRFKLDDCLAIVCRLWINDDLQIHPLVFHDPFQG